MTEKAVTILEARPEDAAALRSYMRELVAERLPTLLLRESARSVDEQAEFLRQHLDSESRLFLVAKAEGRIVGQLRFVGEAHERCAHGGTIGMSVHESCRGEGVGTRLLRELFRWVERHASICRVELEVLSNNPRARDLYARLGFEHEGVRRGAVRIGREAVDACLMARLWAKKGSA